MPMVKAPRLKNGDTIGIVSPSSGLAGLVPHRFDQGIKALETFGFTVKIGKHAKDVTDWTAGTPEKRAEDVNAMFADKEVAAILCSIGGFHANQIINLLDYNLISKNPKLFIGFSDISVLHLALNKKADLVTFYGPALLTQFGESFGVLEYTQTMFNKALMGNPIGKVEPSLEWTDEVLNWFQKKDLERPRNMKPNDGYFWLKPGQCQGELIGGCITSILHLRGTEFWPNTAGKIFFWELPESNSDITKGEPVSRIDAHLTDLELSGTFDDIVGMIVGRPKGYTAEESKKMLDIILKRTEKYSFPILCNIDIGHTDPIMTLPIGVKARLDSENKIFEITESATK
jgi:muramoyltetrapeptide carboxypeptidase